MSASVRATGYGVEIREGDRRTCLYKHQLPAVADYLHDQWEHLEQTRDREEAR